MGDDIGTHVRVAALADIPDGGCLAVEAGGQALVLVRFGDEVRALENRCPHAGAPLSEGFVEGRSLTCAWHGWTFDVASGRSLDDAQLAVPTYDVRIVEGQVLVQV